MSYRKMLSECGLLECPLFTLTGEDLVQALSEVKPTGIEEEDMFDLFEFVREKFSDIADFNLVLKNLIREYCEEQTKS